MSTTVQQGEASKSRYRLLNWRRIAAVVAILGPLAALACHPELSRPILKYSWDRYVGSPWLIPETEQAMDAHLVPRPPQEQKTTRFITLHTAHNALSQEQPTGYLDGYRKIRAHQEVYSLREERLLRLLREAVPKLAVNRLGPTTPVYAVKLSEAKWTAETWNELVGEDPYAVEPNGSDPGAAGLNVRILTGTASPHVRLDWLVYRILREHAGAEGRPGVHPYVEEYLNTKLTLEQVLREIDVTDQAGFRRLIEDDPELKEEFGFDRLLNGGVITRRQLEQPVRLSRTASYRFRRAARTGR